jgi:hypothetical protein
MPVLRQPYPPHYRAAFASSDLSFPLPHPLPYGRETAEAGGMGLPQLATEKLQAGEVGASDPVGVTDAAARWHLTRSYPLPVWARRISLISPILPYEPLMALHSRSTFPPSPSPLLPSGWRSEGHCPQGFARRVTPSHAWVGAPGHHRAYARW